MQKYGVACAASDTYTEAADAIARVREIDGPVVVKATGSQPERA